MNAQAFARAARANGLTAEQALRRYRLHATIARLMGSARLSYKLRLAAVITTDTNPGQFI